MKRCLLTLFIGAVVFGGCLKDTVKETYTTFRPVYRTRDEVKNNIRSGAPIAIAQPGKILVKDHYLFLNDVDKGVHVIDIANPSKPVNTAFIAIPGNVDIMVNGNYLYADCYTDLVTIDITNPAQVSVKQFLEGIFPERYYSNGFRPESSKVITGWERVETSVTQDFSQSFKDLVTDKTIIYLSSSSSGISSFASSGYYSSGGVTLAGSLARFALQSNRMYAVSHNDLKVFNTSNAASPSYVQTVALSEGSIETIFPYKSNLFIGSQTGMFIYNISNPDNPVRSGQFTHARSCDPVIADDKYAYVTLSSGSACAGFSNQLDVINVSNLSSPTLVKTYPLTGPRGLSKDGNLLFICDGKDGLKIFNAGIASSIMSIQTLGGFTPSDVIAANGLAITVAKDGIYLVAYTPTGNAVVAGKILVSSNN